MSATMTHRLQPGGAFDPRPLVALEGACDVVRTVGEGRGEDGAVLHGLSGSLAEEGEHRVGRITEESGPRRTPPPQWRPVQQRPLAGGSP